MSRTYNKHNKSWNYPKRQAKFFSKKNRRQHGKKLLINIIKVGPEENEMPIDADKNYGSGDIWIYD